MPARTKPTPPVRRLTPRLRRLLFLTRAEHRKLEKKFTRDMRKLQQQLDQAERAWTQRAADGRDQLETIEQFYRRWLVPFKAIFDYYASVSDHLRRPPHKGRPPGFKPKPPPANKVGAPVRFPPAVMHAAVTAIDRAKARAAEQRRRLTDEQAVRLYVRRVRRETLIAAGHTPADARRLAHEWACERERAPGFPKWMKRLQERLSRVRHGDR